MGRRSNHLSLERCRLHFSELRIKATRRLVDVGAEEAVYCKAIRIAAGQGLLARLLEQANNQVNLGRVK